MIAQRYVFTGPINRIENNCAVVIESDGTVHRYNLNYYKHVDWK